MVSTQSPVEREKRYDKAAERFYNNRMSLEEFERIRSEYDAALEAGILAVASSQGGDLRQASRRRRGVVLRTVRNMLPSHRRSRFVHRDLDE